MLVSEMSRTLRASSPSSIARAIRSVNPAIATPLASTSQQPRRQQHSRYMIYRKAPLPPLLNHEEKLFCQNLVAGYRGWAILKHILGEDPSLSVLSQTAATFSSKEPPSTSTDVHCLLQRQKEEQPLDEKFRCSQ